MVDLQNAKFAFMTNPKGIIGKIAYRETDTLIGYLTQRFCALSVAIKSVDFTSVSRLTWIMCLPFARNVNEQFCRFGRTRSHG